MNFVEQECVRCHAEVRMPVTITDRDGNALSGPCPECGKTNLFGDEAPPTDPMAGEKFAEPTINPRRDDADPAVLPARPDRGDAHERNEEWREAASDVLDVAAKQDAEGKP